MLLAKQFRELILALLGIAVATGIVRAQPQGNKIWTVEARRRPSGSGVRRADQQGVSHDDRRAGWPSHAGSVRGFGGLVARKRTEWRS
jgi:hypothetical protein